MTTARTPGFPSASDLLKGAARWPALVLFVLALLAWLPGVLSLPPLDRDESRFAQASKQMVESGDLIDIRFSEGARYNKPVGIYWLQAASEKVFGGGAHDRIWVYRVPSLIGGFLALLFLYWCARSFAPPEMALLAAMMLGATLLMSAEAEIATTDAVLLASIVAAQAVLMRVYLAARKRAPPPPLWVVLAGWVAIGVGILVKGPVILGVLLVTIAAVSIWDRDVRWLKGVRPLLGIPLALAIVLPWAIAIGIESHGAFYRQSLGHDFGSKMIGGQESHGAPPGYFLALSSLTLWPATLLVLPSLIAGIRERGDPVQRFLLSWAGAAWLMFEIVPTKLPHYILPAYPALAMLAALWAMRPADSVETTWERVLRYFASVLFVFVAFALVAAPFLAAQKFDALMPLWIMGSLSVAAVIAVIAAILLGVRKPVAGALLGILAAVIIYPTLTIGVAPGLTAIWTSPRAAALIEKDSRASDPPVVLAGYVEPSLVFLLGTQTRLETGAAAADIAADKGGLILVEDHERKHFMDEIQKRDVQSAVFEQLTGFDYSRGKPVHLTLYRTLPAMQPSTPPEE